MTGRVAVVFIFTVSSVHRRDATLRTSASLIVTLRQSSRETSSLSTSSDDCGGAAKGDSPCVKNGLSAGCSRKSRLLT